MESNIKTLFSDRRFLNREHYHSSANVVGILYEDKFDKKEYYRPFQIEFFLSNCERTLKLAFDSNTKEDVENSIFKLRQIEEVARGLKEAIQKQMPDFEKWLKEKKNKKQE